MHMLSPPREVEVLLYPRPDLWQTVAEAVLNDVSRGADEDRPVAHPREAWICPIISAL
jgi:hypothetical protein